MRCTISQVSFDKELYMFGTDLSIIRSLNTVYIQSAGEVRMDPDLASRQST